MDSLGGVRRNTGFGNDVGNGQVVGSFKAGKVLVEGGVPGSVLPWDVDLRVTSECERRHVWRGERDGMSAISRRSFMELEAGDNKR